MVVTGRRPTTVLLWQHELDRWGPAMKPILTLPIAMLGLVACAGSAATATTVQPTTTGIPTATSSLIGSFIRQTDGRFGYQMLRPAGWESRNGDVLRYYAMPGFRSQTDGISFGVINLQPDSVPNATAGAANAILYFFQKDPTLEGWTKNLEQMWRRDQIEPTLLATLPQAKIYWLHYPATPWLVIEAYIVDQNHPIVVSLEAAGAYADLERLRREGIFTDFSTVVASVHAIRSNPANVYPPLP
jgi:hypothetical protein